LAPLIQEARALNWYGILDVIQNFDEVRLREDHFSSLGKVNRSFYVIEERAAVIEDGPRDLPAVFGIEAGLQRINFLEFKCFVYLPKIILVIAVRAE
jgi:hypothetical protein